MAITSGCLLPPPCQLPSVVFAAPDENQPSEAIPSEFGLRPLNSPNTFFQFSFHSCSIRANHWSVLPNLLCALRVPGDLIKRQILFQQVWSLRFCISSKCPEDADATGPGTTHVDSKAWYAVSSSETESIPVSPYSPSTGLCPSERLIEWKLPSKVGCYKIILTNAYLFQMECSAATSP